MSSFIYRELLYNCPVTCYTLEQIKQPKIRRRDRMNLFELYNVLKEGQKGRNNFLVTVIQGNGTGSRYFLADGEVKAVDSQDGNHPAEITGKEISDQTGWYELYIEKNVPVGSEVYMLTFAMDLGALYEKIVAPVKIGEAGYSSVKDQNMNIIMHHVKNQIGLEAVDGRIERYPYLDMSSLNAWIMRQENENSGTGVIDTYVWDDPELKRVRRVVAFQAISIQGERWIVNSTLPVHELSGPLESMMTMLIGVMLLYMMILFNIKH